VALPAGLVPQFTRPPIVIGGCARSGTTLLLSILSSHSKIFALKKETGLLASALEAHERNGRPLDLDRFARRLAKQVVPASCHRWCEKTPRNVRAFGGLLDAFGADIRLIHVVRDGRDVVTSIHPRHKKQLFVSKERWVEDVGAGLAFADHPQVLTVRYEDLTRDYPNTISDVCAFLGEEVEESLFAYPDSATIRSHRAWSSPALAVHSGSVERWRDPEYAAIIDDFMRDASAVDLLGRLGYL
jgi:hypothetical protein